ncbi:RNA-directed DNA polymerase, eukaryota, partial [Tanacetum coccineum]
VETIDVATGLKFNVRAMVLWTINDFPARSSLSGWSGQGYKACPTCNEDTPSVRVLGKTAYVGHRRFLKKPHKWRRSLEFNGERFVVHSRDECRTTQNSGICSPGPDGEMYYGQLEQILEFSYLSFKTVLFRVKWFDTSNKGRIQNFVIRNNITQIKANGDAFKNDQYILTTQVNQYILALSTSLNDLEIAALHINGQSIDVDAP